MLNRKLKRAFKTKRMMRALTGLEKKKFIQLLQKFKGILEQTNNRRQDESI